MNGRQARLAVVVVLTVSVAARLGSLFWSSLPYNPDGIFYARWATDALAIGQLDLAGLATDAVGFTSLLSAVSLVTGHPPLYIAQVASAAIGGVTVLFAMTFARRLAPVSWSPAHTRLAGTVAGLLLAVDGLYLYRSMATDETTAGLLLLPTLALAVGRGLETGRNRWTAVAVVVLLSQPPLHNHDGVLSAVLLTVALGYWLVSSERRLGRKSIATVGVLGVVWIWVVGYHLALAQFTPAEVIQTGRLQDAPGLLVAWLVVGVLGVGWFGTTSRRLRLGTVVSIVVGIVALLALNAVVLVFPGTMSTSQGLLAMLVPLAGLGFVGALGVDRTVGPRLDGDGLAVLSLLVTPMTLIGFAVTAGLTPVNLSTAFRTHLYLHVPLMTLAGIVVVGRLRRRSILSQFPLRQVTIAVVVLCAVVSVPVAFTGLEHRPYRTITTQGEFAATEFATTHLDETWATDDHFARVSGYHAPGATVEGRAGWLRPDTSAVDTPIFSWIQDGTPPPTCPVLARNSWSTTGAQIFPRTPIQIDSNRFTVWRAANHVVYAGGSTDRVSLVRSAESDTIRC